MPDFYSVAPYDAGDEQMGCRPRVEIRDWCVVRRDGKRLLPGIKLDYVRADNLADELNAAMRGDNQ